MVITDKNKVLNTKLRFLLKANPRVHKEDGLTDFRLNDYTRNFLTFANTTAIAYGRKVARSLKIFAVCNSSRVCKRQKITSTARYLEVCPFTSPRVLANIGSTPIGCHGTPV